jgi:hypothetical protein
MIRIELLIEDDPDAPRCQERVGPLASLSCERQEGHTRPPGAGVLGELADGDFHLAHDLAGRLWLWAAKVQDAA